jgi:hypothetical protein
MFNTATARQKRCVNGCRGSEQSTTASRGSPSSESEAGRNPYEKGYGEDEERTRSSHRVPVEESTSYLVRVPDGISITTSKKLSTASLETSDGGRSFTPHTVLT